MHPTTYLVGCVMQKRTRKYDYFSYLSPEGVPDEPELRDVLRSFVALL